MDPFEMFKLMLDDYSSEILKLTEEKPLNAVELSEALGIPMAACYRRIRALRSAGMLKEEGKAVSIGGKMVAQYRSSIDSAEVMLQDGRLRIIINLEGQKNASTVELSEETTMLQWPMEKDSSENGNDG